MLTFYYNPMSPLARRVWIALLEKGLAFETVLMKLNGDQLAAEFLALNPFHHVPVLVDDDAPGGKLTLIESLAILDYLEARYPEPALMPTPTPETAGTIARIRMAQLVVSNEIAPAVIGLVFNEAGSEAWEQAIAQGRKVCGFLSDLLGAADYFGGEQISLGDIVVGNSLLLLAGLGFPMAEFGNLLGLSDRLKARPAWQPTLLSAEQISQWRRGVRVLLRARQTPLVPAP